MRTSSLEEVESAITRADGGRVTTGVGVISTESPIRRLLGKLFDYEEMKRVCAFARSEGIATHMDGARLFMAAGEELMAALNGIRGLRVEEIPSGSNLFKLHVDQGDAVGLRAGLREKDILLSGPNPNFNGFAVGVNETLTRKPVEEIERAFSEALGA